MRTMIPMLLALAACSTVTPGQAVVRVDVCGTQEEKSRYSIVRGGRVIDGPCTDYYWIPTREQQENWTIQEAESISFTGVDGQPVGVDVGLRYQVEPDDTAVIRMVRKFGPKLETTVNSRVRNSTKDAFQRCASDNGMTVQDIYGARKGELVDCVENRVAAEYSGDGLLINDVTLASEIRLPEQIRNAMERAMVADQEADKARREVEQTRAEGEKRVAAAQAEAEALLTRATAEAEANRITSASLTPQILEMRRLEIEARRVEKWSGAVPTTVLGGEANVLYNIE